MSVRAVGNRFLTVRITTGTKPVFYCLNNYSRIPVSRTSKGNKNWFEKRGFEKSKVASNVVKLLRYCFIMGNHAHFRSNRWEMADLSFAV